MGTVLYCPERRIEQERGRERKVLSRGGRIETARFQGVSARITK
jgi:hypothetical protein